MMRKLLALSLTTLLLLGGCSSLFGSDDDAATKKDKKDEPKTAEIKKIPPICPQVAVIRELDTIRDYGDEKPDPSQLVGAGKMVHIDGDCAYLKNKDEDPSGAKAGIDISYELAMTAGKGPRLGGRHIALPFFVAVVDPNGNILTKDRLTAEITFASDERLANHAENLHVFIPLREDRWDTGPYYRVLAGFQLTQAQLDALGE